MLTAEVPSILVVDDDDLLGRTLSSGLRGQRFKARHVTSAAAALEALTRGCFDLVVTDYQMPGMDGLELVARVRRRWADVPIVMMTAFGSVHVAVEAMKLGAADFLLKPLSLETILPTIQRVLSGVAATRDVPPPHEAPDDGFVGSSAAMRAVRETLTRAGQSQAAVLVHGESGTGKELAARLLHQSSPRASKPFVAVNCGALTDSLFAEELFGHEQGAYTGALAQKPGRFDLARGGTLFLDEVGEIPLDKQPVLLRVLQEREFERVGGREKIKTDVRIVAATHRPLADLVAQGRFREDLYFRLNVVPIVMPPLRDRVDDLDVLARHFCATLGANNGRPAMTLEDDALAALRAYSWPGNVRELQNFMERLVVLSDASRIRASDVQREFKRVPTIEMARASAAPPAQPVDSNAAADDGAVEVNADTLGDRRRGVERETLVLALERTKNNRAQAARLLGISRRTLYNKLELYKLA
jgi:two-component system, NtrC family, response regulator AtoC